MKKVMMFSLLLLLAGGMYAQTLDDINAYIKKSDYAGAKAAIDKYMTDPKNTTANVWFIKATVYNNYSNQATLSPAMAYDLKEKAFEAYKKTAELDKNDLYLKADEYRPFLYVYSGMFNLGAKQFGDKDFTGAIRSFEKAQEAENYILSKKYTYSDITFSAIDTPLVLNIAAAYRNLQNDAAAAKTYRKLVDANIAGSDNMDMYTFLVSYYRESKDDAALTAVLAKAKAAYPGNSFWDEIEVDRVTQSGDKNAMFAKYEELYAKNPGNFTNTYNYAVEIYNSLYGKEPNNPDPVAAKEKLTGIIKSAIAADTTIDGNMLMTNHLYNYASEYSQQSALVSGTKPDDIKKKKELAALSNAKLNEMIPYGELVINYYKSHPPVKTSQKINFKNALEAVSEAYTVKGNSAKAAEYDKLKDAINYNVK